jgi:glycosyltransferase involved in cell wall biosynthesis
MGTGLTYEIIVIDDGSTDDTPKIAAAIGDETLRLFSFKENCGKSAALSFAVSRAAGAVIVTMDGDLQDDPSEIPRLIAALETYEVVCGWRRERNDPGRKKLWSGIYNCMAGWLFGIGVHDMNCGLKAYRSYTWKNLKLSGEMHRYMLVLLKKQGFSIGEIKVHHRQRINGVSRYGGNRILNGLLDLVSVALITSRYGRSPLHLFGRLSLLMIAAGLVPIVYSGYLLAGGTAAPGVATLAGIALLLAGIITFIMGLGFEMIVKSAGLPEPVLKG